MIAIGSDHAGLNLKKVIIEFLEKKDYKYKDFGTYSNKSVDYPDFGEKVANAIVNNEATRGILICGTGIGMSISANKVHGIRAALCTNSFMAKMAMEHNNSNILALGERVLGVDLALEIVETWLNSRFLGKHHGIRVDKISNIEEKYRKQEI